MENGGAVNTGERYKRIQSSMTGKIGDFIIKAPSSLHSIRSIGIPSK